MNKKKIQNNCGCGNSGELITLQSSMQAKACSCRDLKNDTYGTSKNKHYFSGEIRTPIGLTPRISTRLDTRDYLGASKVRWGIKRHSYRVAPGLYAVGSPNENSDVFVTANYKLTFDLVRKNLDGLNAWLLILDTKGVNVWCSAGKGTFGTNELVSRIKLTALDKLVKHRRLILPQLSATGVAAHLVKAASGFSIIYGPVRISELKTFIEKGYKANKEMRQVNFNWIDRLKLIPNDLIYNIRYLFFLFTVLLVLSGVNNQGYSIQQALENIFPVFKILCAGYFGGLVITPLLLPFIPFQSFSLKGIITGLIISLAMLIYNYLDGNFIARIAEILLIIGFSSFLAMNFTGSSTYTSLAGVKKEMKISVPIQIALVLISTVLFILNIFI